MKTIICVLICSVLSFDVMSQIISDPILIDKISTNPTQLEEHDAVYIVDLNKDGYNDIVSASIDDSRTRIYGNNSDGTFSENVVDFNYAAEAITSGDFNGDGYLDLAVSYGDFIRIYYNDREGYVDVYYWETIDIQIVNNVLKLHSVDMDEDGVSELVVCDHSFIGNYYQWYYDFQTSSLYPISDYYYLLDFIANDFDQDGDQDFIGIENFNSSINSAKIVAFRNQGDNSTFVEITSSYIPKRVTRENVQFSDVNQDNFTDIVYTSPSLNSTIGWMQNDNGQFNNHEVGNVDDLITGIDAADFDNDNDIDIIAVGANAMYLFVNDGYENFTTQLLNNAFCNTEIKISDLDGDGNNDIVLNDAYYDSDNKSSLVWFKNQINNPNVSGKVFYDEDNDGVRDLYEPTIEGISVLLSPSIYSYSSGNNGRYEFHLSNGSYNVKISDNLLEDWVFTTPSQYNFTVSNNNTTNDNLDFGLFPRRLIDSFEVSIVSGITRCNRETEFEISAKNLGTTFPNGILWFVPDEGTTLVTELDFIDTIKNDSIGWFYNFLVPGDIFSKTVDFEMPGVEEVGDTMEYYAFSSVDRDTLYLDTFDYHYETVFRCAYDPNDKLVHPDRQNNYVLITEDITYTIRFQNTGNDIAFDIAIQDELSPDLDLSTFRIIGTSHPRNLETIIENRLVTFNFNDIMLPDSSVNFDESQGFVTFKIKPKSNISEFTVIENVADIYFDLNPPIRTNTTESIIVFSLSSEVVNIVFNQKNEFSKIKSYPNPFNKSTTIQVTTTNNIKQALLFNQFGSIVREYYFFNGDLIIEKENLSPGIYYLSIYNNRSEVIGYSKLVVYE